MYISVFISGIELMCGLQEFLIFIPLIQGYFESNGVN